MWMLKGAAYGLALFFVFFVLYYVKVIAGGIRQNAAIGVSAITGGTIYRPMFWMAFVLTIVVSCLYARLLHQ